MAAFIGLFRRDLRLALRQGSDTGLVLGFFVLAIVLFPLGVGPEPAILQRIGAGVVWVAALLAALLSLDRLFQSDYQDGGLEILALSRLPLELAVLAKCAAHWVATGLPLALTSPFLALLFDLDAGAIVVLAVGLLLGTPGLSRRGGRPPLRSLRQRFQIGDNVLPVFLVGHDVDHLRSADELAGPLEIFVQGLFVPGNIRPLHRRRIVIAGLGPALAAEHAGQR